VQPLPIWLCLDWAPPEQAEVCLGLGRGFMCSVTQGIGGP